MGVPKARPASFACATVPMRAVQARMGPLSLAAVGLSE
jgi:hypothetical protein